MLKKSALLSRDRALPGNHGWMLHVGGGEGAAEDKPGDRETAEEGQEQLTQRDEAAAAG